MLGTHVTIKAHAHYVQTVVRFYGEHGLEYNEYSFAGATVPKQVCSFMGGAHLSAWLEKDARSDNDCNVRAEYLPGFPGYFEMRITFPEPSDHSLFEVEEARFIDPAKGGRSIAGAFKDVKFKRPILNNLFNAIESKDVAKLREILDALSVVGA